MERSVSTPILEQHRLPFLIAFSNIIVFAVIGIFQVISSTPVYYVTPQDIVGYDYRDFYQASSYIARGESPYSVSRYVTPPLPALLNVMFVPLGFEAARTLFISLIPLFIFISYFLIYGAIRDSNSKADSWLLLSGIFVILLSYPFYFLLERGNIDGVVLLCMCAGLHFLAKKVWLSALLLAVAISLKLYPILILASLFCSRRWQPFLWTCGWLLILTLLAGSYWGDYFAASYHRSYYFRLDENGSLANTLMITMIFLQVLFTGKITTLFEQSSSIVAAIVYAVTVTILLYSDYKTPSKARQNEYLANTVLYFPLMVAIPGTVYHYEFVLLIPLLLVLGFLWKDKLSLSKKSCLGLMAVGIALSQWQAVALYVETGNMLAHFIPGFGLLLLIIGIFAYKFLSLGEVISRHKLPQYTSGMGSK